MTLLVTGGAGFIGSNFILDWLSRCEETVVNLDKLTYAGNPENLASLAGDPRYVFVHGDIGDGELLGKLLQQQKPRAIVHFAAESHVDRSISAPDAFIQTNIVGTGCLLEAALDYWRGGRHDNLSDPAGDWFRFINVSSDEVFGDLDASSPPATENRPYRPNSPYSASKAASNHLVRAYHQTYGLPVITTHCSNNYGPYQFPEKLIPLVIFNALENKPLPIYGDGKQVRDWLHVADHCRALRDLLVAGNVGETYNIGGLNQNSNLDTVIQVCRILDEIRPRADGASYATLIKHVDDRPGHDRRYAIDCNKICRDIGWRPAHAFAAGLRETVTWYLENATWVRAVTSGEYRDWIDRHYTPAAIAGRRG